VKKPVALFSKKYYINIMMRTEREDMDQYVLSFVEEILENDKNQDLNAVVVTSIVEKNHASNGYFSWDGILDDLTDLIGYEKASEILRNC
jgi:hypothetical protein